MDYYAKLFELFLRTIGVKIDKDNYKKTYTALRNSFIEWLESYKISTLEYKKYVEQYLDIDLGNYYLVELGKGNIDSIVHGDAGSITSYGYTFTEAGYKNSELIFKDNKVFIDYGDYLESAGSVDIFMAQNPYVGSHDLSNLHKIHNLQNREILLGMYGKLTDKDRKSKIKILKQFKKNIDPDNQLYDFEYNTKDNNYYFGVITKK